MNDTQAQLVRLGFGAVAAVVGGILLHFSADPLTNAATEFWLFVAGALLLVLTAAGLYLGYRPGQDRLSADEVNVTEAGWGRFLRIGKLAAPLYLGVRVGLGWQWIQSGVDKLQNPAWTAGGTALRAFWQRAATVPNPPATPTITYPAYRSFITFMLSHHWYTWFAWLVSVGELAIGITLLLGFFTGFAALAGLLMNFNYLYAGTTSVNPTLIVLEALVLYGWRASGWWGIDYFLLPRLGTPWQPGSRVAHFLRRGEYQGAGHR